MKKIVLLMVILLFPVLSLAQDRHFGNVDIYNEGVGFEELQDMQHKIDKINENVIRNNEKIKYVEKRLNKLEDKKQEINVVERRFTRKPIHVKMVCRCGGGLVNVYFNKGGNDYWTEVLRVDEKIDENGNKEIIIRRDRSRNNDKIFISDYMSFSFECDCIDIMKKVGDGQWKRVK